MADPYSKDSPGVADPASNLVLISVDDFADMSWGCKALRIANPSDSWGEVKVKTMFDNEITLDIPPQSVWIEPLRIKRIYETGTTVGLIIAGYTDIATGDEVKTGDGPE